MPFYAVRDKKSRDLVGLFSVETTSDLFWLVEETCPPQDCEYALLLSGGVILPRRQPALPMAPCESWQSLSEDDVEKICQAALLHVEPEQPTLTRDVARELEGPDGLIWEDLAGLGRPAIDAALKACLEMA